MDLEELRKALLSDSCAGAFSGMPAMIMDVERIRNADAEELLKLAKEHGITYLDG